jgi:predicted alpha/beta-fold hydrolase
MLRRQSFTLPDGDFLSVDWGPDPGGPIVLLLHGLGGNSRSHLLMALMRALHTRGFWAGIMHFRGTAGEPNRKLRSYHMAEKDDPGFILQEVARRFRRRQLSAVGISLGGSALLHTLAKYGDELHLRCAVAISVPYYLPEVEKRLNQGLGRLYQWYWLRTLKRQLRAKCRVLARPDICEELQAISSFRQFDDRYTAPLHGFRDADDYYQRASSLAILQDIRTPTLLIHAANDPLTSRQHLPEKNRLPSCVELELHTKGGHAGFMEGWGNNYLARRIPEYILQYSAR